MLRVEGNVTRGYYGGYITKFMGHYNKRYATLKVVYFRKRFADHLLILEWIPCILSIEFVQGLIANVVCFSSSLFAWYFILSC
ncbi:hypothetical protein P8452_70622 [Trifolium repens]|nr:hypothetical protein P8452_70622 [Trifolium repens]